MDEVHVWLVRSPLPALVLARLAGLLDERERARAGALDPVRRRRFVAAHGAARLLVGARVGVAPQLVRWTFGPHGKPEVDGVRVSLSHSGDLAAVALTPARAVGVDVQRHTPASTRSPCPRGTFRRTRPATSPGASSGPPPSPPCGRARRRA
ncbi:4'-phosphopantetheinyl transferase family protein [Phytohabitans flavus]|uniref:4'-phosphopantetheinyl transferase family protein n=1 Tax=Phytohabitans flavus TaxID=1076124 RepID=UPI003639F06F